jgi:short-subunit dehydrogenase
MTTNTNEAAIIPNPAWFITGCSSGFGREFAKHVPKRGGI